MRKKLESHVGQACGDGEGSGNSKFVESFKLKHEDVTNLNQMYEHDARMELCDTRTGRKVDLGCNKGIWDGSLDKCPCLRPDGSWRP